MCFRNAKFGFRLVLSLLESIFFSGLLSGWNYLSQILVEDGFFAHLCRDENTTEPGITPDVIQTFANGSPSAVHDFGHYYDTVASVQPVLWNISNTNSISRICSAQEDAVYRVYVVAMFMSSVLLLLFGLCFDFIGTLKVRMLTIFVFTSSMLMLTFINKTGNAVLLYCGLTLASTSGLVFLATNLQVANLFPRWRATAILSYHVAYQLGVIIAFSMKRTYSTGLNIQSSFMFYTVGVVPLIISTIALLPRRPIPCPLTRPYAEKHETLTNYIHWWTKGHEGSKIFGDRMTCRSLRASLCNPRFALHLLWVFLITLAFDMVQQPLYIGQAVEPQALAAANGQLPMSIKYGFLLACPLCGIILDFSLSNDILEIFRGGFRKRYSIYCVFLWCVSVPLLITRMMATPQVAYALNHADVIIWTLMIGGSAAHIYTALPYRAFGTLYSVTMVTCRLATLTRLMLQYLLWRYFKSTLYSECWRLAVLALCLPYPVHLWLQSRTLPPEEGAADEEDDEDACPNHPASSHNHTADTRLTSHQNSEARSIAIRDGETVI